METGEIWVGVMVGKPPAGSPRSAAVLWKSEAPWSRFLVAGRGASGAGVAFLEGPPWWEAMSECDGGDAKPNKEDEKYGRKDRAQSDVVLRNVGGGKSGAEACVTTVSFFCLFFFLFNLDYSLFPSGQMHTCAQPTVLGKRVHRLECKPCTPKPPATVHPAIPKLKPTDQARQ